MLKSIADAPLSYEYPLYPVYMWRIRRGSPRGFAYRLRLLPPPLRLLLLQRRRGADVIDKMLDARLGGCGRLTTASSPRASPRARRVKRLKKKTSDVMCRQGPVVYKRRDVFVSVFSLTTTWDDWAALASLTAPRQTPP